MNEVDPKLARRIAKSLGTAPDLSKIVPRRCSCGNPIELASLPGGFRSDIWTRGRCATCARDDSDRLKAERLRAQLDQIPEFFRWADLSKPFVPPGCKRAVVKAEAIRQAKEWAGRLLIIRGDSGTGKTSLAAARYRFEVDRGVQCAFVCCEDLSPDGKNPAAELRRALAADLTVFDDLGADLSNAPAGGGLAAYRGEKARRALRTRYRRGKRSIVTTPLSNEALASAYGEDVERRLTEDVPGTLLLRLVR